jgi:hypothetical protein
MRRLLCAVSLALLSSPCYALVDVVMSPGVWVAYSSDARLGLGAGALIPLRGIHPRLKVAVGFTYHFEYRGAETSFQSGWGYPDSTTRDDSGTWQVHGDLIREFNLHGASVRPYLGAGIGYARTTVTTHTSSGPRLNRSTNAAAVTGGDTFVRAIGGSAFSTGAIKPFVEAAVQARASFELLLAAGIRF